MNYADGAFAKRLKIKIYERKGEIADIICSEVADEKQYLKLIGQLRGLEEAVNISDDLMKEMSQE